MVGVLGWLNAEVPVWVYWVVALLSLGVVASHTTTKRVFGAWLVFSTLYCAATFAALYLTWTPVGMGSVFGVQGRYFIPVVAAIVPFLTPRFELGSARLAVLGLLVLVQLQTLYTISSRYYHLEVLPSYFRKISDAWM